MMQNPASYSTAAFGIVAILVMTGWLVLIAVYLGLGLVSRSTGQRLSITFFVALAGCFFSYFVFGFGRNGTPNAYFLSFASAALIIGFALVRRAVSNRNEV